MAFTAYYRAWNTSTNAPAISDATNHAIVVIVDNVDVTGLAKVEKGNGLYHVVLTDGQCPTGARFAVRGSSSTTDVVIIGETGVRPNDKLGYTLTNAYDAAKTASLNAAGVRSALGMAAANLDTQLADLPTVAEFEARTIPAANYFDPATDTVARVTLVDTTTANTDMRGTDNAALAATALSTAVWTNTKAGYIDAAISSVTTGGTSAGDIADAVKAEIFDASSATNKLKVDSSGNAAVDVIAISNRIERVGGTAALTQADTNELQVNQNNWTTATGFAVPGSAMTLTSGERTSISSAIWSATTRTITAMSDSTGVTTLLSRITGLLQTKAQADSDQSAILAKLPTTGRAANATEAAGIDAAGVRTAIGLAAANLDTQLDNIASSSGLDAAGVRTALGMAAANLDTQLADLPTVAEFEARTIPAANYFDPATDTVARVTLVDTTTVNTDMRGTDAAALAATALSTAVWTNTKAGYIDVAISSIATSGVTAADIRAALGMAAANLDTQLADLPTVAEFEARTLVAANYFDPATDTVARVTLVDTTTANTDMRGTDNAALAATALSNLMWTDTKAGYIDASIAAASTGGMTVGDIADAVKVEIFDTASQGNKLSVSATGQVPSSNMRGTDNALTDAAVVGAHIERAGGLLNMVLGDTHELQTNQGNWLTATGFATPANLNSLNDLSPGEIRDAIGLATANLDIQLANIEAGAGLDAAGVRSAIGMAAANLDTQLGNIPTVSEFEARTLVAANYFDPATDTVARVTLVDTTTANTDMRGTDDAALAATALSNLMWTDTKAGFIDAAISAVSTSGLSAQDVRDAVGLSAANLDTQLGDIAQDTGTAIPGILNTIISYIDTEIGAIKAKTDNLPADPASETTLAVLRGLTDAIKNVTDQFVFSDPNKVDANASVTVDNIEETVRNTMIAAASEIQITVAENPARVILGPCKISR